MRSWSPLALVIALLIPLGTARANHNLWRYVWVRASEP